MTRCESSMLRRSARLLSLLACRSLISGRLLQIIKSDFILLSGDVVSNLDLMQAVEAHRERRKVSKDAILTMLVKEGGLGTHSRSASTLR